MPPTRPHPSATLPRNFHFHYRDGEAPKTPEPQEAPNYFEPPPPPRQPPRRRGTRLAIPSFSPPPSTAALHDIPIPTIEQPLPEPVPSSVLRRNSPPDMQFLAPQGSDIRPFSPPKTPLAQLGPEESSLGDYFDVKSQGESISRPSTACSNFSDSSASSDESLESFPSFGCSSASPESENNDPFGPKTILSQESLVSSPLMDYQGPPKARMNTHKKTLWTEEMDNHLWVTFLKYLRDPTHTPFKLFPGAYPPLGVCHRVANEAKRSWRAARGHYGRTTSAQSRFMQRNGSPDTIRPINSGESTPTGIDVRKPALPWPRNSSTRRRLRLLCKRKPTLSAHYQRLMQNRSPSPFESSSSSNRVRSGAAPVPQKRQRSAFSTRDMNISLTSALQSGNSLSELASDAVTPRPRDEMTDRPVSRSGAHQRSHSLQLGIEASSSTPPTFRMLASPFHMQPQPQWSTWSHRQRPSVPQFPIETSMSQSPKLEPPAELHPPAPLSRTLKRRARLNLDDANGGFDGSREELIHDMFGATADSSHRRVRSRGFSLGDMEGERRVNSLAAAFIPPEQAQKPTQAGFTFPSQLDHGGSSQPSATRSLLAPPQSDMPPRLGSPFEDKRFATIPRNFKMPLDPSATFEPAVSFEDRLGALAPGRVSKGSKSLGRNFTRNNPSFSRLLREQQYE